MFVLFNLQDYVEVNASNRNRNEKIYELLSAKYLNKYIEHVGIAMFVLRNVEIVECEIIHEILLANVKFSIIFQKFYKDEVQKGKIVSINENGLKIANSFFSSYFCNSHSLFENTSFDIKTGSAEWIWNYKNNRLPFKNGTEVMFRIESVDPKQGNVNVSMNEPGLGPISWW